MGRIVKVAKPADGAAMVADLQNRMRQSEARDAAAGGGVVEVNASYAQLPLRVATPPLITNLDTTAIATVSGALSLSYVSAESALWAFSVEFSVWIMLASDVAAGTVVLAAQTPALVTLDEGSVSVRPQSTISVTGPPAGSTPGEPWNAARVFPAHFYDFATSGSTTVQPPILPAGVFSLRENRLLSWTSGADLVAGSWVRGTTTYIAERLS